MRTRTTVFAVALLVASFSLAVAVAPATADGHQENSERVVDQCAAEPPTNFADPDGNSSEVVGWVEGYWYDEPLNISIEDGLNESELDRLSARTAARFEALRCLTVQDGLPPVEIVPREEFATNRQSRTVGETARLLDNAKFETTLTIDSQTDSTEVRQADSAERVGGFYNFITEEIVIVTDDPEALRIDESTLAEELGHAIQDQQFDLSSYERPTVDRDKGVLGLIEGDVGLVVDEYLAACEAGEWSEPCLVGESDGGGGGPDIANWGLYFEEIHPYSDGLLFIQQTRATGGWDEVNALYDDPPTSALHVTYPDTLGAVELTDPTVPDRSTDAWDRVLLGAASTSSGPLTHDTLGISTITGMFAAPAYEDNTARAILPRSATTNFDDSGSVDQFNPHDFAHPETSGWRGDAFYTYTGEDNETATVWELVWASPEDAEPFVEGYEQLVDIRGGERVEGYAHTYSFDTETGYDIAVTLVPDGDRVTVVTAPTVEALTEVDQQLELLSVGDDGHTDGGTDEGTTDESDEGTTDDPGDGTVADGSDDGTGGDGRDDPRSVGTDNTGNGGETDSDTELGIIILPAVGLSFLVLLAVLSTGRQRGQ